VGGRPLREVRAANAVSNGRSELTSYSTPLGEFSAFQGAMARILEDAYAYLIEEESQRDTKASWSGLVWRYFGSLRQGNEISMAGRH
jgi:hypothetical protein